MEKSPITPATSTDKNIHMISLGCARNLVDSEVMLGLMRKDGYAITGDPENADVIVINTCGFIDSAKKESVETILEAAEYKDPSKGRCQKLIVAGCLAERYPGQLKEAVPEIDLVMGTAGFSKIVDELEKMGGLLGDSTKTTGIRIDGERLKDYDLPRVNSQPFYTAYLKLAEGCAKRCSFCIIPDLRGPLRSRAVESLIKEANDLVLTGVRELNLIAQDLTDYGRDRKDGATLANLLRELIKVEGLEWIRLFYAYPDQLSDEVINLIKTEPKICKYLDVPVQHIDDGILKGMNRKTTGTEILAMLKRLKSEIPELVLRTSLMVGFPGEGEKEFDNLLKFIDEGLLDQVGIFTYSHEEGTKSFKNFEDTISDKEKARRQKLAYARQAKSLEGRLQSWIGKTVDVLIEGQHDETNLLLKARHYGQAPEIDNHTIINKGSARKGSFARARITEIAGNDLVAEIISG